jgi:hypothetical protein
MVKYCDNCRVRQGVEFKKCGRCKYSHYCGKVCQQAHWKSHKEICREICEERKVVDAWLRDNPYKLFDQPPPFPGYIHELGERVYKSLLRDHKLRKYGKALYRDGGMDALYAMYYTLLHCTPLRNGGMIVRSYLVQFNHVWDGIGDWRA